MTLLQIKDELNTIDFIESSMTYLYQYQYMDDTLDIGYPDVEETRISTIGYSGNPIRDIQYKTRKIKFDFRVIANSENSLTEAMMVLQRIISRVNNKYYHDGGAYSTYQIYPNNSGVGIDNGDVGVRFIFWYGNADTAGTVTRETGQAGSDTGAFNYKVGARILRVELTPKDRYLTTSDNLHTAGINRLFRHYSIELECEPYFYLPAIAITDTVGSIGATPKDLGQTRAQRVAPEDTLTYTNRILIPSYNIAGTEPAPTRIATQVITSSEFGQGIIIARDAGVSVLNAPSSPVFTGTGLNDLIVSGQYLDAQTGLEAYARKIVVEILTISGGDTYRWSIDGGTTWAGSSPITAKVANTIISSNASFNTGITYEPIKVQFSKQTGHVVGDRWEFYTHQSYLRFTDSINIYSNRDEVYADDGYWFKTFYLTVPYGCKSKYRVYLIFATTGYSPEFMMKTSFMGNYDITGLRFAGGENRYDWTLPGDNSNFVDLGMLDFTTSSTPSLGHPNAASELQIKLYTRTYQDITNPATLTLAGAYFIPAQDDNSWFHASWPFDGRHYQTFCNFDLQNPYMCEAESSVGVPTFQRVMPLDGSYGGGFITLIPGQNNTIMMIPLVGSTENWRESAIPTNSAYCDNIQIAYRPTFVNI